MAEITISVSGIDEIVRNLTTIPIGKILAELMEQAKITVDIAYASQINLGTGKTEGNKKYSSFVSNTENSATLTVSGSDVGFLEFGAGIFTSPDEFAEQVGFPVSVGSYSAEHMGMFQEKGFWWWNKTQYAGIFPTHGMHEALERARKEINENIVNKIAWYIEYGK